MTTFDIRKFLASVILTVSFMTCLGAGQAWAENSLAGAWTTKASGAPFEAHVFTFHADGTMMMSGPAAGNQKTSQSTGVGPWEQVGGNGYIARFVEVSADPASGAYTGRVVVDLNIAVTSDDTFRADAVTNYYKPDGSHAAGPFNATLVGTRIPLPMAAQ